MQVIGVGFGRTGTFSLREALEELGFGPCYHMTELYDEPHRAPWWLDAASGGPVDWDAVLAGYESTVDWPGCYFWKELVDAYPDAKVILTVRDPSRWYESTRDTVYGMHTRPKLSEPGAALTKLGRRLTPELRQIGKVSGRLIWGDTFGGQFENREHALNVFNQHIREVTEYVSPERLLVYQVGDGWQPLCDFLGAEAPNRPFPSGNARGGFHALIRERMRARLRTPVAVAASALASLTVTYAVLRRRR